MTTIITDEDWIDAIIPRLRARADEHKVSALYWVDDDDNDYCLECIRRHYPDLQLGGGYWSESDSPAYCEDCGVTLTYTLTDYGALEEYGHFIEYGWDWNDTGDCFAVARVLGAWIDDDSRILALLKAGRNIPSEAA